MNYLKIEVNQTFVTENYTKLPLSEEFQKVIYTKFIF